ncbi:hypothetical protein JKP88DRAFT_347887 [Tribonema minus]|uniref:Zn(2)-C6 fungal-type domain-containing protein n=1 Tax=Tribonema minus TaxID=303371 RepID=A0A836CIK1_9STRA|nr:hypothetical protein JKP88DRAFT_347887 [Tribonema minus]
MERKEMQGVLKKACIWCVKEKRRCGGGHPCEQCVVRERGNKCAYEQRRKSGPKSRGGGTLLMVPVSAASKNSKPLAKKEDLEELRLKRASPLRGPPREVKPWFTSTGLIRQKALYKPDTSRLGTAAPEPSSGGRVLRSSTTRTLRRSDTGASVSTSTSNLSSQDSVCSACERQARAEVLGSGGDSGGAAGDAPRGSEEGDALAAKLAQSYALARVKHDQEALLEGDGERKSESSSAPTEVSEEEDKEDVGPPPMKRPRTADMGLGEEEEVAAEAVSSAVRKWQEQQERPQQQHAPVTTVHNALPPPLQPPSLMQRECSSGGASALDEAALLREPLHDDVDLCIGTAQSARLTGGGTAANGSDGADATVPGPMSTAIEGLRITAPPRARFDSDIPSIGTPYSLGMGAPASDSGGPESFDLARCFSGNSIAGGNSLSGLGSGGGNGMSLSVEELPPASMTRQRSLDSAVDKLDDADREAALSQGDGLERGGLAPARDASAGFGGGNGHDHNAPVWSLFQRVK